MNLKSSQEGVLIWITGLPGSGKTTLAKEVYRILSKKLPSIFMDGDIFRKIIGRDLGYTKKDRLKNAFRLARMNQYLAGHGMIVICATVSLYSQIHAWNRKHIKKLIEIYIEVPHHILRKRDQKRLYSDAQRGKVKNLIGVHQTFDIPQNPDIIISNSHDKKRFLVHAEKISHLVLTKLKL